MSTQAQVIDATVRKFLHTHIHQDKRPLLCAVSGGVDSTVLLHSVKQFCDDTGIRLEAIHIHHGIRAASDKEVVLVENHCKRLGIPLHVRHLHLGEQRHPMDGGFEASARTLRYQAFQAVAGEVGAHAVCLGHHGNDQVETVLWRLIRGTSLTGLSGIRPISHRDGLVWLRPLLPFRKNDLYDYAHEQALDYSEDESNTDIQYTRNYIRHEVIPKLEVLQPNVVQTVGQLAEILQEEDDWLHSEASVWVKEHTSCDTNVYHIPLECLRELPRPLQRRVIKIILYCLASGEFSLSHIQSVVDLAGSDSPSSRVDLPFGLMARRTYEEVQVGRFNEALQGDRHALDWELFEGSRLKWNGTGLSQAIEFTCRCWTPADGLKADHSYQLKIPRLKALTVRSTSAGDRIAPLGLKGHTKKLQDVFTDAKVHKTVRDVWPLFCSQDEIIWIPGLLRSQCELLAAGDEIGWVIEGIVTGSA